MLAMDPGEVIQSLDNFVVEQERTVGVVAEDAEAKVEPRNRWNAPALRIRLERKPQFLHNVAHSGQLLRAVVDQRNVSKTELVHLGGRQDPRIRKHVLLGIGVERDSAERQPWLNREFIGPTVASKPLRVGALVEVDALIELVLIDGGLLRVLVVVRHRWSIDVGQGPELHQLKRDRIEARLVQDLVAWEWHGRHGTVRTGDTSVWIEQSRLVR